MTGNDVLSFKMSEIGSMVPTILSLKGSPSLPCIDVTMEKRH